MTPVPRRPGHAEALAVEQAGAADVSSIRCIVEAAYSKYVERLGKPPAALGADYGELVKTGNVYVLRAGGAVVGSVLLSGDGDSVQISNLVVDTAVQGRGYGRALMDFAERTARARGLEALTLFTNAKMHENVALYTRIGFKETERRTEEGFNRVSFRKQPPWRPAGLTATPRIGRKRLTEWGFDRVYMVKVGATVADRDWLLSD